MTDKKVRKYLEERGIREAKSVDEWGVEEWKTAYNVLAAKHERLRDAMRKALNNLSSAI